MAYLQNIKATTLFQIPDIIFCDKYFHEHIFISLCKPLLQFFLRNEWVWRNAFMLLTYQTSNTLLGSCYNHTGKQKVMYRKTVQRFMYKKVHVQQGSE